MENIMTIREFITSRSIARYSTEKRACLYDEYLGSINDGFSSTLGIFTLTAPDFLRDFAKAFSPSIEQLLAVNDAIWWEGREEEEQYSTTVYINAQLMIDISRVEAIMAA